MDNFEKIEKLVEKTGVSYKEAKRVLEEANGDILDAMIILEQEGKAKAPKNSSYSTQYYEQSQYVSVPQQVDNLRRDGGVALLWIQLYLHGRGRPQKSKRGNEQGQHGGHFEIISRKDLGTRIRIVLDSVHADRAAG